MKSRLPRTTPRQMWNAMIDTHGMHGPKWTMGQNPSMLTLDPSPLLTKTVDKGTLNGAIGQIRDSGYREGVCANR